MKATKGLIFFALGVVAGLLGNVAARKVSDIKLLPDRWFEGDDMDNWDD